MRFPKQTNPEGVSDGACAPPCCELWQTPSSFAHDISALWDALFLSSSLLIHSHTHQIMHLLNKYLLSTSAVSNAHPGLGMQ